MFILWYMAMPCFYLSVHLKWLWSLFFLPFSGVRACRTRAWTWGGWSTIPAGAPTQASPLEQSVLHCFSFPFFLSKNTRSWFVPVSTDEELDVICQTQNMSDCVISLYRTEFWWSWTCAVTCVSSGAWVKTRHGPLSISVYGDSLMPRKLGVRTESAWFRKLEIEKTRKE